MSAVAPRESRPPRRRHCDGPTLLRAFRSAVAHLERHVDQVNALNVFPVPDGDTGSNMLATVRAALIEAERVPQGQRSLSRVAQALSHGSLMGARGNSGLILSQVVRGMAEVALNKHRADGVDLGDALTRGAEAAYQAVGHPVEGTILTVAREAAESATAAGLSDSYVESVLETAVDEAQQSVARTPSLLPALREAGVVDSGGHGLFLLLRGLLIDFAEDVELALEAATLPRADFEALHRMPGHDGGYGFETMFVLHRTGEPLHPTVIRNDLEEIGESVMVAGDAELVNVHVHNPTPDTVIAYATKLGALSQISILNLDDEVRVNQGDASVPSMALGAEAPVAGKATVVVAVAPGDGLARAFEAAGAIVVRGGAAANPSTEELLRGIRSANGAGIALLANHKNVVLVARQAAALAAERNVAVIETRNAAEGIAAVLAVDPRADVESNTERMRDAVEAIQTLQVTRAVRDARVGGRDVRQGEQIVLDPDEGVVASAQDAVTATLSGIETLRPGWELLTVYVGTGVDPTAVDTLTRAISARYPDAAVELVDGGQPHYDFLIAAE